MSIGGPGGLAPWPAGPALRCGPVTATWDDVLEEARRTGLWGDLDADVARRQAAVEADPPDARAVTAAAVADRRSRRLLAADDLRAWLASWGLTDVDWLAHLRRDLIDPLADAAAATAAATPAATPAAPAPAAVWATAVCRGTVRSAAARLAEGLAAADVLGADTGPESRDAARARLRREAATETAVTASVRARGTGATRFRWRRVQLRDADAAREAVLCLREDGLQLSDLGLVSTDAEAPLDAVPSALRTVLLAAGAGSVVHPVPGGEEGDLLVVDERIAPDPSDSGLRTEAGDRLGAAALAAAVADRVVLLGPLAAGQPR